MTVFLWSLAGYILVRSSGAYFNALGLAWPICFALILSLVIVVARDVVLVALGSRCSPMLRKWAGIHLSFNISAEFLFSLLNIARIAVGKADCRTINAGSKSMCIQVENAAKYCDTLGFFF
jgi:hypothetical protein